jgi:hypothetical protein
MTIALSLPGASTKPLGAVIAAGRLVFTTIGGNALMLFNQAVWGGEKHWRKLTQHPQSGEIMPPARGATLDNALRAGL